MSGATSVSAAGAAHIGDFLLGLAPVGSST